MLGPKHQEITGSRLFRVLSAMQRTWPCQVEVLVTARDGMIKLVSAYKTMMDNLHRPLWLFFTRAAIYFKSCSSPSCFGLTHIEIWLCWYFLNFTIELGKTFLFIGVFCWYIQGIMFLISKEILLEKLSRINELSFSHILRSDVTT